MAVYGSQLWDYSTNAPEAFYTAWRKCFRRIDGLPNKTHKIILPVLWDVKPIHVQLHKRWIFLGQFPANLERSAGCQQYIFFLTYK